MTGPLADKLARRIRAEGPLSVAAFMAVALHDPEWGYYRRRRPLGAAGDFVTAPEISQVFGELIGLWCAEMWQRLGRPDPVLLVELGPGTGTLMSDLLRAAAVVPAFAEAIRLVLVEASPLLRAEQQRRLAARRPLWLDDAASLPSSPMLLVANEFLDALPVRQLVRGRRHWAERMVALDGDRLAFANGPENPALDFLVPAALRDDPAGTLVEICPAALGLAATLGERLTHTPGAALFVDYGDIPKPPGPSLRAIRGHRPAGALDAPGEADLSTHVDFAACAEAARAAGAAAHGPVPQRDFLRALGVESRLGALCARATPAQRAVLVSGVERLVAPDQMGSLFKAIALASPDLPPPPGFEAAPADEVDRKVTA